MKENLRLYVFLMLGGVALAIESWTGVRDNMLFWGSWMALAFLMYGLQMREVKGITCSPRFLLLTSILLRLLPFLAMPFLSDDYFRFIWDGRLLIHGINPFLQTPRELISSEMASFYQPGMELFEGMNSPDYYTIYPPVLQGIFALSAWLFPHNIYGSVMVMKSFVLIAEIGSVWLLGKLLEEWELPLKWAAWYAWNPLVIIELTGNLHFEALMIFGLLAMIYLLVRGKIWWSVLPFVLAICCKMLPLMLSPLLIRRLGWGKVLLYGLLTALGTGLLFLMILDAETFSHMLNSVELYIANFEFNASLWYVIRESFGHLTKENPLEIVGKYLALASVLSILLFTFLEKKPTIQNLPKAMLWVFGIYFLFASIVHPWYVTTAIALGSLSVIRFPMLWSVFLPLTYWTYQTLPYQENLWIVLLEYVVVMGWLIGVDLLGKRKPQEQSLQTRQT
ncbi:MAG: hypothetical protein AAFY71_06415 [Bacteroidota bacterium]